MTPLPSPSYMPEFFPFQFLLHNTRRIVRQIALPYLAGALAIYGFFAMYITELEAYLLHPQESASSRILGIAAAAVLVLVLFHSMIMARIVQLALGLGKPPGIFLGISRMEWRLYTANVQFCLVVLIFVLAFYGLHAAIGPLGWFAASLLAVTESVVLFGLAARIWFLLAPICAANGAGNVLLMAWQKSASPFWRITFFLVLFLLLAYFVQVTIALALNALGLIAPFRAPTSSLVDFVASYRENLLPMVIATNLAYAVFATLTALASVGILQKKSMACNVASS